MTLQGLPVSCYPGAEPANKLATSKAKAIKAKVRNPFPLVDIADFLPSEFEVVNYLARAHAHILFHVSHAQDIAASDQASEKDGCENVSKSKTRLDMVRWIAAFQAYVLAAEAAEVHCFALALASSALACHDMRRYGHTPRQWLICARAWRSPPAQRAWGRGTVSPFCTTRCAAASGAKKRAEVNTIIPGMPMRI